MSIKFLVFGRGGILGLGGGGGECRFYFYGREDFSDTKKRTRQGDARKISVCDQVSDGTSYQGDPGQTKNGLPLHREISALQWYCTGSFRLRIHFHCPEPRSSSHVGHVLCKFSVP